MHKYLKHAGFFLAVIVLSAGLSACKEDKTDGNSGQAAQQQSRSDLKTGFGGGAGNAVDTVKKAAAPAMDAAERISGETMEATAPRGGEASGGMEEPSLEITGSVKRIGNLHKDAVDAVPTPADDGNAAAGDADKELSEDERFAAELAREAEQEEAETRAVTKGESR